MENTNYNYEEEYQDLYNQFKTNIESPISLFIDDYLDNYQDYILSLINQDEEFYSLNKEDSKIKKELDSK